MDKIQLNKGVEDPTNSGRPRHIAVIMDGNGRWAAERGKPRVFGHQQGAKKVREIIEASCEMNIDFLTLYAFSAENWKRPQAEVKILMKLLSKYLLSEKSLLQKQNIQLKAIGDLTRLPKPLQITLQSVCEDLSNNTGMVLTLALSYSGQQDIVSAAKQMAQDVVDDTLSFDEITCSKFDSYLSTNGCPDVDFMIRTSGEQRISNFLLWQVAYAELYFAPEFWPDFGRESFQKALLSYQQRNRRFGNVLAESQTL